MEKAWSRRRGPSSMHVGTNQTVFLLEYQLGPCWSFFYVNTSQQLNMLVMKEASNFYPTLSSIIWFSHFHCSIFCTKVKYDTWKDRNYVHFLSKVVGPCCNAGCLLQILQVCNSMCSIRWPSSSLWWERCQQCGVFHNSSPKMVSTFLSEFEFQPLPS